MNMFITKRKHDKIVAILREEIREAQNLKQLLSEIVNKTGIPILATNKFLYSDGIAPSWAPVDIMNTLDDSVPRYVEDILGGKVIKQESVKAIVISKDGVIKEGLTKQKADNGFSYKLVRK